MKKKVGLDDYVRVEIKIGKIVFGVILILVAIAIFVLAWSVS